MTKLTYKIQEGKLKSLGYEFKKLYAGNHKVYTKKIGRYMVCLWVSGKTIEIEDWHENTDAIINFYKENKKHKGFDELYSDGRVKGNIKVQMNPENGFVQLYDYETYFNVFRTNSWDEWKAKYDDWYNEIFIVKTSFEEILKEIEILNDCN